MKELRDKLGAATYDKKFNPLNERLVKIAEERGLLFHGTWRAGTKGRYRLEFYEQRKRLLWFSYPYTLVDLRELNSRLDKLLADLESACS